MKQHIIEIEESNICELFTNKVDSKLLDHLSLLKCL